MCCVFICHTVCVCVCVFIKKTGLCVCVCVFIIVMRENIVREKKECTGKI